MKIDKQIRQWAQMVNESYINEEFGNKRNAVPHIDDKIRKSISDHAEHIWLYLQQVITDPDLNERSSSKIDGQDLVKNIKKDAGLNESALDKNSATTVISNNQKKNMEKILPQILVLLREISTDPDLQDTSEFQSAKEMVEYIDK